MKCTQAIILNTCIMSTKYIQIIKAKKTDISSQTTILRSSWLMETYFSCYNFHQPSFCELILLNIISISLDNAWGFISHFLTSISKSHIKGFWFDLICSCGRNFSYQTFCSIQQWVTCHISLIQSCCMQNDLVTPDGIHINVILCGLLTQSVLCVGPIEYSQMPQLLPYP